MPSTRTFAGIAGLASIALAASMAPLPTATAAPTAKHETVDLLSAASGATRAPAYTDAELSRSVNIDGAGLDAAGAGDRIDLQLFGDAAVTAVLDKPRTIDGTTSWTGSLEGEDGSFTAVEVDGVRHITVASAKEGTFEVTSTKAGDYVLTEVPAFDGEGTDVIVPGDEPSADSSDRARRADRRPAPATAPATSADGAPAAAAPIAEDEATTIDVAIVYPASLVAELGEGPMQAQFAAGIAQTNQAFVTSGIPTQVRLVGTRQLAQPQMSGVRASLLALQNPADGQYDEVAAFREEVHADLISMWHSNYGGFDNCGIGFLGTGDAANDPAYAFTSLYGPVCSTGTMTFAHEIGHNLSAGHDAAASESPGGKPYARGYVDLPAKTYTVMAYPTACQNAGLTCTRVPAYSNPSLIVNGRPQGTATPPTINTQAIIEQIGLTANYRQSQIYPAAVALTGNSRFKGTVRATTAAWTPAVAFGYQWYLDGAPIAGATSETYKPTRSQIGVGLSVIVTGNAPYYAPLQVGTAAVIVGKATFKTKRPKVRGVPRAGRVLKVAKLKGWKPKPGKKVKVRYQWLKNGKKIKGAKKSTYRVRAKDRRKKISVKVTIKKKGYEKTSRSSKKIKIRR